MLYGIALISGSPFRIQCKTRLTRGSGDIIIHGPVEPTIEETINVATRIGYELSTFGEGQFPDLSVHNLHIQISLPKSSAPIVGPSYQLLLGVELVLTFLKKLPTVSAFLTGELAETGDVRSVGGISEKRAGVRELGGTSLVLPAGQLDFFSHEVIQIPVQNLYEAYTAVTYGQT